MTNQFRMIDTKAPQCVRIDWVMETPWDDRGDAPDERNDGFYPSHDKDAAGYVEPERYDEEMAKAELRMNEWRRGAWGYVGVVAVANIVVPVGETAVILHTLKSGGLWGIESDAGDYLKEVFEEEKAELLAQLMTLSAALQSGNFTQEQEA